MFKKKDKPKRNHSGKNLSQYGLFDMPTDVETGLGNDFDDDDDGGDSDLEAELAALSGGGATRPQRKKPAKKIIPQGELDAMIADSLKDVGSDDDVSVDENDPDLLGELNELTGHVDEEQSTPNLMPNAGVSDLGRILSERLKNYEIAENKAKVAGESSKAKRYGRAIKTLKDLIKQANSGTNIDLNDESVPPEIHISDEKPSSEDPSAVMPMPSRPAPKVPIQEPTTPILEPLSLPQSVHENVEKEKQDIDQELLSMLADRQREYKVAALKAKKSGDAQTAIRFVKIAKQFDAVIEAVQSGQAVDLSKMPGPPEASGPRNEPKVEESETQQNTIPEITVPEEAANLPEPTLIMASTVLEALEQRLAVYKEHEKLAKDEGNSSKARRYGRIVKQFDQAIKQHKAGKPIPFDELPTPPGYGPIPVDGVPAPKPKSTPAVPKEAPASPPTNTGGKTDENLQNPNPSSRSSGLTSHADKQVLILLAKQKQFKQAALNAKQQGEITQAKEFLRQAKGFDKLIDAARGGLPVDWSSIPVSPDAKSQLDNEYNIVMSEECSEESTGDLDVLARLDNQLQKQLKMCLTTRDHNKSLGDVAGTNKFERLALNVSKDLDIIRIARKSSKKIPKFHYEMKDFAIVKSFTDIMDNHMEVSIHRGINYQSEKGIDTYVKLEFPFPQETPFSDRTSTIKDTINPEYNKTFVIPIQRNSRQCQRVFKRHGIKFEVYSKGCCAGASDVFCCFSGLFRSDVLIGTANVKLQPLETQCEIHDSFDLLEGRKKVGGKLEIQIRLRNPIVTQQVEQIQEKWLIIDQ